MEDISVRHVDRQFIADFSSVALLALPTLTLVI